MHPLMNSIACQIGEGHNNFKSAPYLLYCASFKSKATMPHPNLAQHIHANITAALEEDVRPLSPALSREREREIENRYAELLSFDLTAQLIPAQQVGHATVITRQDAVLCGTQWFDGCFKALDPDCTIDWFAQDGDTIKANQTLCEIHGNARAMLTAERAALNFLQTLSATATRV